MSITITVSQPQIQQLDLSPVTDIIEDWLANQSIVVRVEALISKNF